MQDSNGVTPLGSGSIPDGSSQQVVSPLRDTIPNALEALAVQCEMAKLPSPMLDVLIAEAVGWGNGVITRARTWSVLNDTSAIAASIDDHFSDLPRYTLSIDAAMTLVPEGAEWLVGNEDGYCRAEVENSVGRGATPALALSAAALKARAE